MTAVVEIRELRKTFGTMPALNDISLDIHAGEMVALIGPSGSGKSTLLRHLSGLTKSDRHAKSNIRVLGKPLQQGGKLHRDVRQQRANIGCIFQQFNLVSRMSVIQNVLMGFLGRISRVRGSLGVFTREERAQAMEALERVGLHEHAWKRANQLSGGQQQRVAIARALVQKAQIILADEPIASLDPESSRRVMEILSDINQHDQTTVIVTLHQVEYARQFCRRTVALRNGALCFDGESSELDDQRLQDIYGQSQLIHEPLPLQRPLAPVSRIATVNALKLAKAQ